MNDKNPATPPDQTQPALKPAITIHLNKIPLLSDLDGTTLQQVANHLLVRKAERGAYVLHKGSPGEHLLFLLAGRLQVVDTSEEGREVGLSFVLPGDYFGELSIIDGEPRSASVIACETSLVALLPRAQAQTLIYNTPLVAERLLQRMAKSIRNASSYRAILGLPNAFQRVYALLLHLSAPGPGGLVVIEKMPSQQQISIMVNTSRETVSRALQVLIRHGVVEKDLRRLIVRQPEALRKAATSGQPEPQDDIDPGRS
ncbi:Crp/Fnr family transcriptional regulator [Azovibrio restrictus]|uniref:Crp/Fnr family transcriptional regulator n=1 Tax=Azovibrio restrictus TaxID=146938 RepID=UPI00040A98D6|nr:Crp/Fnr family transcriptional regulator [Azovibrio restrictus]